MNKKISSLLFIPLIILSLQSLADSSPQNPNTLYLTAQENNYSIQETLRYLDNVDGKIYWHQVQLQPAEKWRKNSKKTPNFSRGAYWFTFKISNYNSQHLQWILEVGNPRINLIDVYYVQEGVVQHSWVSGESRPLSVRPIQHRTPLFPVYLDAGESIEVYIQAKNDSTLQLPLALWEKSTYRKKNKLYTIFWGMCIGLITVMIFYNCLMYSAIRDKSYLFYSGYDVFTLIFLVTIQGIGYQFIWPNHGHISPLLARSSVIFIDIFLILLVIELFDIKKIYTKTYRTYITVIMIHIGILVLMFMPNYSDMILAATNQLTATLVLCTGIARWIQGDTVARNFTLAWVSVFIGILIYVLSSRLRLIPINFITIHAITIGIIVEVALQSFVLNTRFNSLRAKRFHMQASTATKKYFLANISREIRSPLNAIVSYAKLNNERHKTLTLPMPAGAISTYHDGIDNDYLLRIKTASNNLLNVINDILYLSSNESIDFTLKKTDFNIYHIFAEQADMFACNLLGKNINIIFTVDRNVSSLLNGDPGRLSQALTILINNAVKYTTRGEITIRVKHSSTPRANETILEFIVADSGCGISAEKGAMIMTLFNEHAQRKPNTLDSHSSPQGVLTRPSLRGLDLCSKIIGIMEGSMHLDTTLDQGCAFHFTARFQHPNQAPPKTIYDELGLPDALQQKSKILVIDKALKLHAYLRQMFELMGINTELCTFLQKYQPYYLAHGTYDLIMLEADIPSPSKNLHTTCLHTIKQIKHIHQYQAPIILMCQTDQYPLLREANTLGVNIAIDKPINPFALRQRMLSAWSFNLSDVNEQQTSKNVDNSADKTTAHLGGAKVLLVEDNPLNRELALALLSSVKIHVTCTCNGREAVDKVLSAHFDAVLMDIQMPVMDGLHATKMIRSDPQFARLPIIAVTAGILQSEQSRCFEAGMDDLIAKPIDSDLLFDALKRCIPSRGSIINISQQRSQISGTQLKPKGQLPKNIPGIHLEDGLRRTQNNIKLFRYLLEGFYQSNASAAGRIRQALTDGNTQLAGLELHTIKGLSAAIGAHDLAELAIVCEANINSPEYALESGSLMPSEKVSKTLASQLHQFEVALIEVCASAECTTLFIDKNTSNSPALEPTTEYFNDNNQEQEQEQDKKTKSTLKNINEQLHILSQQLKDHDLAALNTIEQIQQILPGTPELKKLEKHILALKFTEAIDCLESTYLNT